MIPEQYIARLRQLEAELEDLRRSVGHTSAHGPTHEISAGDEVRPAVMNSGTLLARQRALNFEDGLDAVLNNTSKRIDVGVAAHGASKHTDRTVKIPLIPLLPTAVSDAHGSLNDRTHIEAADGVDTSVYYAMLHKPIDYVNGGFTLKFSLTVNGASAGNIKIQRVISYAGEDADAATTVVMNVTDGQVAPTAANTSKLYTFTTASDPADGEMVFVKIAFLRADGVVDTNTDQVSLYEAYLEYTRDS